MNYYLLVFEQKQKINLFLSGFPVRKFTLVTFVLATVSVWEDFAGSHEFTKLFGGEFGETPVLGSVDLLSAWELHFGSSKSFVGVVVVSFFGSNREDWISDVDSGNETVGFTVGTSHTGLEPIGTSTGQHFVDSGDVV